MSKFREITINYTYQSSIKGSFKCKSNETIRSICEEISRQINVEFNSIYFLLEGRKILKMDYKKSISKYVTNLNKGSLEILVYEHEDSQVVELTQNNDIHICFAYKSDFVEIRYEPN